MATPPKTRHKMKTVKLPASAFPSDVTLKSNAEAVSNRLRPNLSLNPPASNAPTRQGCDLKCRSEINLKLPHFAIVQI